MNSEPEPALRGKELASQKLLDGIRKKGRTIVFAKEGSEEMRLLQFFRANANVGGEDVRHIILQEDARKIEALEEFLHGVQKKLGILDNRTELEAEIHVKKFMISHCRWLRLSEDDVQVLRAMLAGN